MAPSTAAKYAKRLFKGNLRLPACDVFATYHQIKERDIRLDEILKLDGLTGGDFFMGISTVPLQMLRYIDGQIRLYNDQGHSLMPHKSLSPMKTSPGHEFLLSAILRWIILEGDNGSQVLQYRALIQDPSKYESYGDSMNWKTAVDEIPPGLNAKELDNWLWKRAAGEAKTT